MKKVLKKNKNYKIVTLLLIFLFSTEITFCEEFENSTNISEDNNEYNYKKILIYTLLGIITLGITYFLFFSGSDGNIDQEDILEIFEPIKNIPANVKKPKPYLIPENEILMINPFDYYIIYDCYNSVNIHLSKISNVITTFSNVYYLDLPIVHMSNTTLNEIHWSTKLGLEALKNLPKNSYVAFAHYNPSFSDIYYQILTAEELQKIIEEYNMTKPL